VEYVYLLAGLPRLELTDSPPLTSAELLAAMDGVVRPDHREEVRAILQGRFDDVRHSEARRYLDLDIQLRNALARLRARRAGAEYDARAHTHQGYDLRCEATAAHAGALQDPLARELALDRFRWALLDEIATMPAFGVQALFAYAFKLRLSEKWAAMSDERGLELTAEIVERELAGRVS
jgi:hypothetical protein